MSVANKQQYGGGGSRVILRGHGLHPLFSSIDRNQLFGCGRSGEEGSRKHARASCKALR